MRTWSSIAKTGLRLLVGLTLTSSLGAQTSQWLTAATGFQLRFEQSSSTLTLEPLNIIDQKIGAMLEQCGSKWAGGARIMVKTARASQAASQPSPQLMGERVENVRAYAKRFGTQPPRADIYEWDLLGRPDARAEGSENMVTVAAFCPYRRAE